MSYRMLLSRKQVISSTTMKYQLALILLFANGCNLLESDKNQREELLTDSHWQLVAIFDDFHGEWIGYSGNTEVYEFKQDGSFVQFYSEIPSNMQVGHWRIANNALMLHYTDDSNDDLEYEIVKMEAGVLELQWMGRHGRVIQRYHANN